MIWLIPLIGGLFLLSRPASASTYTPDYSHPQQNGPYWWETEATPQIPVWDTAIDNWDLQGTYIDPWADYINIPTGEVFGPFQPPAPEPETFAWPEITYPWEQIMSQEIPSTNPQQNIAAFLTMIRVGEGTSDPDGYRRKYGGELFSDMSNHPANLGWGGKQLSDAHCRAVGLSPGCVSTAAGAYQALKGTWNDFARSVGGRDFSPQSQDEFAIWALNRRGALRDVEEGRFTDAIKKSAKEWASLPFSPYGQPTISFERAKQIYADAGGRMIA